MKITGNIPYKEAKPIPFKVSCNKSCTKCGLCAKNCPTKAIDPLNPTHTNSGLCIPCSACIYHCPIQARKYAGLVYKMASKKFVKANSTPKMPSIFI